jgi:hypothetical protein
MVMSCLEWPHEALHSCFDDNRQLLQQFEYGPPRHAKRRLGTPVRTPTPAGLRETLGGSDSGRQRASWVEEQYHEFSNVEFRPKPLQPIDLIELVRSKGQSFVKNHPKL